MKKITRISKGGLGCLILLLACIGFAGHAAGETPNQAGQDVIFVLDNSGSMLKNDPDFITRTVVINFLEA